MADIIDIAGRNVRSVKQPKELTEDQGLLALCQAENMGALREVWLTRSAKPEDIQIHLTVALIGEIARLTDAMGVLFKQLEMLTLQNNRG